MYSLGNQLRTSVVQKVSQFKPSAYHPSKYSTKCSTKKPQSIIKSLPSGQFTSTLGIYKQFSTKIVQKPFFPRFYSTAQAHPANTTTTQDVPILESLTSNISPENLTQEKLLLKIEDLVPLPDNFAVVHIGGKQYKVTQGDIIMIERIDVPIETQILLDKVLLLGSKEYTVIGQPMVTSAKVLAVVEEHDKSEKDIIFKKKRRKTYQRKTGHRQPYTLLRIVDIMGAKVAPQ